MSEPEHGAVTAMTEAQAKLEAARCLMCDDPPCVAACPAQVPVKHFIRAIRFDSPRRAINLIRERNVFAGVCGLACPVDQLCVGACTTTELSTPIAIGRLQHYAAVQGIQSGWNTLPPSPTGAKVAVVGAGPSGLAAAAELARLGHRPTVFEKQPRPGGICTYGVPSRRLPQELVDAEIEYITGLGVQIKTSSPLGNGRTIDHLLAEGHQAVYLSIGLQRAATPGLPGEDLQGVTTWMQLLQALSAFALGEGGEPSIPKSVIIVGGGSVALDAASAAWQLGAQDIELVCLEGPNEMPAYRADLDEAWHQGVRFHTRSMPLEITGRGGRVTGLRATRIRWKQPESLVPSNAEVIEGTEYWLPGSTIVFAIGARPDPDLARALPGVDLDDTGRIKADPQSGATSRAGVFAGGDAVAGGGMTIVQAVAEGKQTGQAIDAYLRT
jgi:glutamate synthase (NADPH/NADH) small chain